jgi:hypothetical protein
VSGIKISMCERECKTLMMRGPVDSVCVSVNSGILQLVLPIRKVSARICLKKCVCLSKFDMNLNAFNFDRPKT